MDEIQFNLIQKNIIIPPLNQHSSILQQYKQNTLQLQSFIQNNKEETQQLINGQLIPIIIQYQQSITINHQIHLKKDQQYIRIYPSYLDTQFNVNNVYKETKSLIYENQQIYCKILELNISEEYLDTDLELIIIGTYEQKYNNLNIKNILRNEIPKEQYKQLQYQHSIKVNIINPFDLEYKYFGNTIKMNISFNLKYNISLEDLKLNFLLNESQMIWKDVNINRIVPKCMLQNISINKQYFNNNEGFIEILLDWPAMLQNQELQPNLPSRRQSLISINPVLEIQTPLYITWGQDNYTKCEKIIWKVKPIQQVGAQITEVIRYQDNQKQEFLALKITLINYSNKEHQIVFCPPSQIYGKKLNQKKDQPLVVLGITLSTEKNLGILQPCQSCETILRVQLINNGILNMQSLNLKIDDQMQELSLNFLYSYQ